MKIFYLVSLCLCVCVWTSIIKYLHLCAYTTCFFLEKNTWFCYLYRISYYFLQLFSYWMNSAKKKYRFKAEFFLRSINRLTFFFFNSHNYDIFNSGHWVSLTALRNPLPQGLSVGFLFLLYANSTKCAFY